ncbi:MAG TPA: hypothetical protein VFM65_04125 [Flavobacteriaceae bacterium]|nr:hypothetical protein [Flavobacteriaceae bacterium]
MFSFFAQAQQNETKHTEKVWRLNFLNPGVELELSTGDNSTFSTGIGIGFGGAYPDLSYAENGFTYVITPFLDIQEKWFYNFEKRLKKKKSIDNNSGNFVSVRLLVRGNTIESNFSRTSDFDFAVGPTWGVQQKYGNFHLLFDVGTIYYFDTEGNGNWFPIMLQLNLGFDL